MEARAARGDYSAAVQVYRNLNLRLVLRREINAAPSAETTAYERIAARREQATPRGCTSQCRPDCWGNRAVRSR